MKKSLVFSSLILTAALLLAGCATDSGIPLNTGDDQSDVGTPCTTGQTQDCACPGEGDGTKICDEHNQFGTCVCDENADAGLPTPDGNASSDTGAEGSHDADAADTQPSTTPDAATDAHNSPDPTDTQSPTFDPASIKLAPSARLTQGEQVTITWTAPGAESCQFDGSVLPATVPGWLESGVACSDKTQCAAGNTITAVLNTRGAYIFTLNCADVAGVTPPNRASVTLQVTDLCNDRCPANQVCNNRGTCQLPKSSCQSRCDCQPGWGCPDGVCKQAFFGPARPKCCTDPTCRPEQTCVTPTGNGSTCD